MGRLNKNVLITGANGFIGKNLFEQLKNKYNLLTPLRAELDLLDEVKVDNFFKKNSVDVIIHAAVVGGSRKEEQMDSALSQNLRMFFNILKNKKYFKKMIYLGSGAEYDKTKPIIEVKETDFGKTIPSDEYGFFKYVCSKYIEEQDNIVSLRIFGMFGKYEDYRYRFISNAICQNLSGSPITINQNVFFDYVYIDDFVKIVDYFIDHEVKHKFYNIGAGKKIDLLTLAGLINEIADKKSEVIVKNKGLNNEYTCNNQRLMGELSDFKFNDIKDSIENLYDWYKNVRKNNSLDVDKLKNQLIRLISKPTDYYINKILGKNKKFDFKKPVVLFGAAKIGVIYADLCKKNNIKVLAFGDNDKQKWGKKIGFVNVLSPGDLSKKYGKEIQIIVTSLYDDEIREQLLKLSFENIWGHTFFSTVYAKKFSVLAWTNYINSINSNRNDLIECFNFLDDIESKKVFLNIIKYRLTLDRKHLKSVVGNIKNIYFDNNVYKLSGNETFVDAGAFDGDTVRLFVEANNNKFKKIYCFEPDNKSYLDLKKFINKKNDKRIEILKYGLGSKSKTVYFTNDGGLGSKVSNSGNKIDIKDMDSVLKDKVTLIKMDIEGCEQDALLGSKKIILKDKPKLAICVYHNLADLWEIPLLIKKINPDYKIYLRHYNQFLFDTVCYAI